MWQPARLGQQGAWTASSEAEKHIRMDNFLAKLCWIFLGLWMHWGGICQPVDIRNIFSGLEQWNWQNLRAIKATQVIFWNIVPHTWISKASWKRLSHPRVSMLFDSKEWPFPLPPPLWTQEGKTKTKKQVSNHLPHTWPSQPNQRPTWACIPLSCVDNVLKN